jgi:hypothetical protein
VFTSGDPIEPVTCFTEESVDATQRPPEVDLSQPKRPLADKSLQESILRNSVSAEKFSDIFLF